jgi:hypothetical protein
LESWAQVLSQELSRKHAHIHCKFLFGGVELKEMILIKISSDLLRRRFQINTMSGMGYQYKSIFDAVRVIVKHEGIKGLYKGIAPNLLKVAPSMASSWLSFELTRDFFVGLRPEV